MFSVRVRAELGGSAGTMPEHDRWRVRICGTDGAVRGAGTLLGTGHVLTCAHVVPESSADTAPDIEVVVDFVGLPELQSARARVAHGGWVPPHDDTDAGDIALLELEAPTPVGSTTPLYRLAVTPGRAVRIYGFPGNLRDGIWVNASLAGNGGPGGEWVQMNASVPGPQVRAGFSGAPVFDMRTENVIGMVVGRYTDEMAGVSWMLPVETIINKLPRVADWVMGPRAADQVFATGPESQISNIVLAQQIASFLEKGRQDTSGNILVIITGNLNSPESATVRRAIRLADREQRPTSADTIVAQAPEGTVPPPGSVDLAINATDKTPREVFQRIAERTGIAVDQSTEPTSQLQNSVPPMTIVVDGVDDSRQPEDLLTEVLKPLADRGHHLVLGFHRKSSPSLVTVQSWPNSVSSVSDHVPGDVDPSDEEPSSTREWMCADLVPLPVLDLPDPATKVLTDLRPPEQSRICGKNGCTAEIGGSRAGKPALAEGVCPQCATPFSFIPKLSTGDLVAHQYEVVGCLAHGGQGWVYLARDTHLDGNYVALKGLINTNDARRAVAERRFLTTVDHPNIVRIFNFVTHPEPRSGELNGYIVMEYVGGPSLQKMRDMAVRHHQDPMGVPLRAEHVMAYGIEILEAFDYLHRQRLLYGDMSPSNVIRSAHRIKIIDLGAVVRGVRGQRVPARTPRFAVEPEEIHTRGASVQSDIYAVGKTLEYLLEASTDVLRHATEMENGRVSFGIESFRQVLRRATNQEAEKRFPTAAAMSLQLKGVLRETLSLRDEEPRPEPSSVFAVTAALLDAGLGVVPPLDYWTSNHTAKRDARLSDGRPSAATVAVGLPAPLVDADDPAANFLTVVSSTDSRRLIDKLSTCPQESVEIELCKCRAHLELKDFKEADECLIQATVISDKTAGYDWRVAWHHGLLALANNRITDAEDKFADVYHTLPGEDAPKLALGFCYEQLDKPDDAWHYYKAVWRRDRSQVSAAFGLARICLRQGDRRGAVTILDEVPNVSRHYDVARIAAVRILSGRVAAVAGNSSELPTVDDFSEVVSRLPDLYLDGGDTHGDARDRLTASVREVALAWVRETGGEAQLNGRDVLGKHVCKQGLRELRKLLERSFHALAHQARTIADHDALVDLANTVRPWTWW